jgi:hypothetical protein
MDTGESRRNIYDEGKLDEHAKIVDELNQS